MTLGPLILSVVWEAPETLRPGEGILLNEPLLGSGHFPDFFTRASGWATSAPEG